MVIMTASPPCMMSCRTLENPALRTFLKLPPNVEGMVVHKPYKNDPVYPLKEWDVITKIGDTPVDDQGMIKLGDDLRVHFQYEIQHIATNGHGVADHRPGRQGNESQPAGFSKLSAIDSRAEQHLSLVFYLRAIGLFRCHRWISGGSAADQIRRDRHVAFEQPGPIAGHAHIRPNPRFPAKFGNHRFTLFPAQAGQGLRQSKGTSGESGERHPVKISIISWRFYAMRKTSFITIQCHTPLWRNDDFPAGSKWLPPPMKS